MLITIIYINNRFRHVSIPKGPSPGRIYIKYLCSKVLNIDIYTGHLRATEFHIAVSLHQLHKEEFTTHFWYMV